MTSSSEKGSPAAERRVGERALAEAVDGEDRGLVEELQRLVQHEHELVAGDARPPPDRLHETRNERVAWRGGLVAVEQVGEGFDDARTNALTQLGRGRIGERDDEDLLHLEPAFEQQPQVQPADVPRLAGSGGCLDQVDAAEARLEDVEFGGALGATLGLRAVPPGGSNSRSGRPFALMRAS